VPLSQLEVVERHPEYFWLADMMALYAV